MTLTRIRLIAAREARAERGQPDGLVSAVTFVATLILVESLAVGPIAAGQPAVASALFWIAMAFAAILATTRSFERELEDDALDAVLALRLRSRGALVPILVLPVLVPQLVAATNGAAAAVSGDAAGAMAWAGLLVAFALVYSILGLTIVPAALE